MGKIERMNRKGRTKGDTCERNRAEISESSPKIRTRHDGQVSEEQMEAQDEGREESPIRTEGEREARENVGFIPEGGEGETRAKRKGSYGTSTTGSWLL